MITIKNKRCSKKMMRKVDKIKNILTICLCIYMFLVVMIRAFYSAVTYDEAYTYINYVVPLSKSLRPLFSINFYSIANNHLLNTLLIASMTKISGIYWSEVILRLPAIIIALIFYIYICFNYLKKQITFFEFGMLAGSYYINEYLGLARGYGIAFVLVTMSLINYKIYLLDACQDIKNEKKHHRLVLSYIFMTLSAYANSVTLLILIPFIFVSLLQLLCNRSLYYFLKKYKYIMLFLLILIIMITLYHFNVSNISKGKPLYASSDSSVIFIINELISMALYNIVFFKALFVAIFLLSLFIYIFSIINKISSNEFNLNGIEIFTILLIHLLLLMIIDIVFHRGGLQQRTLIPSYALFILGIAEQIKLINKTKFWRIERIVNLFQLFV